MIKILLCFFFIKQSFISSKNNSQYTYSTFNDKFTYIKYYNTNKFQIYLGNELVLLVVQINQTIINIKIENDNNTVVYNNGDTILNYTINDKKVYYIKDKCFLFVNKTCETKFNFTNDLIINDTVTLNGVNAEIFYSASAEYFFVEYYFFAYFLFISGCLITSFGAYHFILSFFVHFFFLIFSFVGEITTIYSPEYEKFIMYIFFSSILISSISSILIFVNKDKKKEDSLIKLNEINLDEGIKNIYIIILNFIYGVAFGYLLFKSIFYYFIRFGIYFPEKENTNAYAYFICLYISSVLSGLLLYVFDLFKKYRYLICSTVAGSFYIIKSIEYIIGGYISSFLFCIAPEKYKYNDSKIDKEITLTYFFIHLFIIVYSVIFQLKYLKNKENSIPITEEPGITSDLNSSYRPSKLINEDEQSNLKGEDDRSLFGNKSKDESSINEDEEINDQED